MDNEVLFECGCQYQRKTGELGKDILFLILSLIAGIGFAVIPMHFISSVSVLLVLSSFAILPVVGLVHLVYACTRLVYGKIRLYADRICVLQMDGKISRTIDLRDISAVYPDGSDQVIFMGPVRQSADGLPVASQTVLGGVGNPQGFAAAVMKQLAGRSQSAAQQPLLTESGVNELHAAEHLLQQGMITPQQMAGMYRQPEPAQPLSQAEINERNAASYMQRQEMLAQQIVGSFRQDEEKSNGQ